MNNKPIQFQKQRDLGDVITDTFSFLRENYKLLFKLIFRITGPVFLILILALSYYSYLGMESLHNPIFGLYSGENSDMMIISFFILMFAVVAFYVLLYATVLHFIRSYIDNKGNIIETEVYRGVKDQFGSMLGLLLLVGIMIFVGMLMCLFPGIYLWVPLSIAPAVLVFRRQSVGDSIVDAFNLIKNNWWVTFFSLFVITILVFIIGLIFQVPMFFYMLVKTLTGAEAIRAGDPSSLVDWFTITMNVISNLAQYLLSIVVIIATAFIYHDLDEKKNFTGSYKTISELGSSEKN